MKRKRPPAAVRAPRLFPKSATRQLDPALFRAPTAEYRGAPFWAWNAHVDLPQLFRQIDHFRDMGFGGFMIHSRTGLATEYLGEEFVDAVARCTDRAAELGMLSWLYDEDRWPSGFAGGIVTRGGQHRTRQLLWTCTPYCGKPGVGDAPGTLSTGRTENGTLLARYEVRLDAAGRLSGYRRLGERAGKRSGRARPGSRIWHAYLETVPESTWFNNQTYVDTFSASAIERFIEVTHERFKAAMPKRFGNVIPAVFTDEPQFVKKTMFGRADETRDLIMPFAADFPRTYRAAYRQDLLDHLPELFWNLPDDEPSLVRWRYHDHTAERFAAAFGDTLGRWCGRNGVALTGHMLAEVDLYGQTRGVGEVMRGLRSFQLPGIDMLCDRREYTTAKQAQSVCRQRGREGVVSELYGVTGWHYDFVGHKAQGDWQAAMGVTVRIPHLSWVSMAGESKRDYPASIAYQSPWYREYTLIEDHFARVNAVMTRGAPLVRVAVIHPIESLWLAWGPAEHNSAVAAELEENFKLLPEWLSHGGIDFDYISEASIQESPGFKVYGSKGKLRAGAMVYDAVVVPPVRTMRGSTLRVLESFARGGGRLIFADPAPGLVDARLSTRAQRLAKRAMCVPFARRAIVDALEPHREIDARHADGSRADSIVHQVRNDGKGRNLFLVNTDRARPRRNTTIRVRGKWDADLLDTYSGERRALSTNLRGASTDIPLSFEAHGHALLALSPGGKRKVLPAADIVLHERSRLLEAESVTLSEPNVLLLDQAEWRVDDGQWNPREELLRIDNAVRRAHNLQLRGGRVVQPWSDTMPAPVVTRLSLRFSIESTVSVGEARLAIENPGAVAISLDGASLPSETDGWWVDESIRTVPIPGFGPGHHVLEVTIPFTRKTDVEWCYLLGDFGVDVRGRAATLTAPVRTLPWGDWTRHGLPFYAGNVTYRCTIHGDSQDSETVVEFGKFASPLLSADIDGAPAGKVAFAPFQLRLGRLDPRPHTLAITAYGNRANAFGPLHHTDENLQWIGPAAWRSEGAAWAYEYHLKRMGILVAPTLKSAGVKRT